MKTLGIIGGMGPLATVDLFRKIVLATEAATDQEHIHILIDNDTNIPDRTAAIQKKGPSPVPELIAAGQRLAAQGAELLVMPCNTAHYFLPQVAGEVPVPFLNMIEATAHFAEEAGWRRVALLATLGTCQTGLYQKAFAKTQTELLKPQESQQEVLHELIYDGVKAGRTDFDTTGVQKVMQELGELGAEAFILGCTELPVAVEMYGLKGTFIDATEVLAENAVEAVGGKVIKHLPIKGKVA